MTAPLPPAAPTETCADTWTETRAETPAQRAAAGTFAAPVPAAA